MKFYYVGAITISEEAINNAVELVEKLEIPIITAVENALSNFHYSLPIPAKNVKYELCEEVARRLGNINSVWW